MKAPQGMSLVEMLVVIAIIGIVSLMVNANLGASQQNANDAARVRDLQSLSYAVKNYVTDNGVVPHNTPNDLDVNTDLRAKLEDFYLVEFPQDPAPENNVFRYVYYIGDLNDSGLPLFEFNALLEAAENQEKSLNDGGNVSTLLEVGRGIQFLGENQEIGTAVYTACDAIQWPNTLSGGVTTCPISFENSGGGSSSIPQDCSSVPTCNGLTADICIIDGLIIGGSEHGTPYTGVLRAENSGNVIVGTPGNDNLYGGNGTDTLCGREGNDIIYGENAGDYLDGGADDDTLYGENGSDTIDGGDGIDSADGGPEPNTCLNIELPTNCS